MQGENTTTINGITFSFGRLSPMKQFHIARRLAPLLSGAMKALKQAKDEGREEESAFSVVLPSIAEVISRMTDEDSEYVVTTCLSVCKRQTDQKTWAPVVANNGQMMYNDMTLDVMIGLTVAVIKENMGSFFLEEATSSPAPVPTKA